MLPPIAAAAIVLAFPALVLGAALRDATTFTIPNWMSLALLAVFPLAALAVGLPLPTLGLHFAVGFAALVMGMIMFALGWIGGGDAKLFAAAALWVGWPAAATLVIGAATGGGVLALLLLSLRSANVRPIAQAGPAWVARLAQPGESVPYGVAIAAGALLAWPAGPFAAVLPGLGLAGPGGL